MTNPESAVYILSKTRRGGSQVHVCRTQTELESVIMGLFRNRREGRALLNNDENLKVGSVEKLEGRWTWWFDSSALLATK